MQIVYPAILTLHLCVAAAAIIYWARRPAETTWRAILGDVIALMSLPLVLLATVALAAAGSPTVSGDQKGWLFVFVVMTLGALPLFTLGLYLTARRIAHRIAAGRVVQQKPFVPL